ncbi:MAG: ribosomal-protein-alanine N-acetyltransferase, partial [Streptococcus parauberis]
ALYKSCGFAALAIRKNYYHNPVEDAVVMKKEGRNDR